MLLLNLVLLCIIYLLLAVLHKISSWLHLVRVDFFSWLLLKVKCLFAVLEIRFHLKMKFLLRHCSNDSVYQNKWFKKTCSFVLVVVTFQINKKWKKEAERHGSPVEFSKQSPVPTQCNSLISLLLTQHLQEGLFHYDS